MVLDEYSTLNRERILMGGIAAVLSASVIGLLIVFQAHSVTPYLMVTGFILGFLRLGMFRPLTDPVERSVDVLRSALFLALVPAPLVVSFVELQKGSIDGDNVFRFGVYMSLALAGLYVVWSDGPWEREREELEEIKERYSEEEHPA